MAEMRSGLSNWQPSDHPSNPPKLSTQAWRGYLKNLGTWSGKRALSNSRGRVLVDLPTRVTAERFCTSSGEECVSWRTAVKTADGIDEVDDEWSQGELEDFGALVADGSFSVGAEGFQGEPITVDQCLYDDWDRIHTRVRTTHAFDWEGCLSGIVASRERFSGGGLTNSFIEPAPWRSPQVLLDYTLGLWEGRGVSIDSQTGETHIITSRLKFNQDMGGPLSESSVLHVAGGGPTRVFDAKATSDENLIVFAEANVQTILLPGGVSVSAPIRIRSGRPFALETAFLMRPDSRKRVIRLYNRDCDWVNTVFINERRLG